jgi:hypothetical protein
MFRKIAECIENGYSNNSLSIQNIPITPGLKLPKNTDKTYNLPNYKSVFENVPKPEKHPPISSNLEVEFNNHNNKPFDISSFHDKNSNAVVYDVIQPVDNKLSRTVLTQKIREGGKYDNDIISLALSEKNINNNNFNSNEKLKQLSSNQLNNNTLINGNLTAVYALNENISYSPKYYSQIGQTPRKNTNNIYSQKYDFSLDLKDTETGPYDLASLQGLFLLEGGSQNGYKFPQKSNKIFWDSMPNISSVKYFIKSLKNNTKNTDYTIQRQAYLDFLGIKPETLISRVPRVNKIEVFWFSILSGNTFFLKRTLNDDIPYFQQQLSYLAVMDVRPTAELQSQFNILTNNDFWISVNQPQQFDKYIDKYPNRDLPGYFAKNNINETSIIHSNSFTNFSSIFPNIMKVFTNNFKSGNSLLLDYSSKELNKQNYSLTCELNAPFLNFEINSDIPELEETRNPFTFSQFLVKSGLQFHTHNEEKEYVPGKKAFVRLNNRNSSIILNNILFQSWKTMTVAIRIQTRATGNDAKDTIFSFVYGKYFLVVYVTPEGSNSASLWVKTNISSNGKETITKLNSVLEVGKWCLFTANNMGNGISISCDPIYSLIKNGGSRILHYFQSNISEYFTTYINNSVSIITVGTKSINNFNLEQWKGFYSTNALNYDIAWIHFFDCNITENEIKRECLCNWIYTQYPQEYGVYKLQD